MVEEDALAATTGSSESEPAKSEPQSDVTASIQSAAETAAEKTSEAASAVGRAAQSAVLGPNADKHTLYVGNLFFDVRGEDLEKHFQEAGTVTESRVIYDARGLSRG